MITVQTHHDFFRVNMCLFKSFVLVLLYFSGVFAIKPYTKIFSSNVYGVNGNYGDPVFMTDLIDRNMSNVARYAASVKPIKNTIESYAGFFTVNKKYNSNLFFWFFPSQKNKDTDPIVVWLQGGPGSSSLFGLFSENGAYYLDETGRIKLRTYYWSQIANVIYIDNPVGTGFSFTDDENGYATDQVQVGADLYEALDQFFICFPEYRKNRFYVIGESYGGKYAPALAYTIHKNNLINDRKIKLKGIGIGNGFTDPINMLGYGEYLNQLGLIDDQGKTMFQNKEEEIINSVKNGDYDKAAQLTNQLTDNNNSLFYNLTGFKFYFNYLHTKDYMTYGDLGKYLEGEEIRSAIHVGQIPFIDGNTKVQKYLENDLMRSVRPWLEVLLEYYQVLIYNGQLDIICAYPLTINYVKQLNWTGADEYKNAQRKKWYVNKELAGYVKKAKNLKEVLVRDAGHMVPSDQPLWALTLLQNFIYNKTF